MPSSSTSIKYGAIPTGNDSADVKLTQFIDRTFEMTRPNIRINGRNFEEMDIAEEGAPLDPFSLFA